MIYCSFAHRLNVNEIRFLKDKLKGILEITAKCEICFSYKLKFERKLRALNNILKYFMDLVLKFLRVNFIKA